MILLNSFNATIEDLKKQIKNKIAHPYLKQFIHSPSISDDKLFFLHTIASLSGKPEKKMNQYILATMLIQIALDTHETVPNKTSSEDDYDLQKNQQLTVLAGDLYSGLYYDHLARVHDVGMIIHLAGAIKEINENKMILYHEDIYSIDHLLDVIKNIESLLLQKFASFLGITQLNHILTDWLLLNRLCHELTLLKSEHRNLLFHLLTKHGQTKQSKHHIIRLVDNMISRTILRLEQDIKDLPQGIRHIQKKLFNRLHQSFNNHEMILEEG